MKRSTSPTSSRNLAREDAVTTGTRVCRASWTSTERAMDDPAKPSTPPSRGPSDRGDDDLADSTAAERLRRRVRRQRRHIEALTGQDPLRGGVDD
jgi:hypothetical protein